MQDTAETPHDAGLADEDRLAVETLHRAFSEGNPELRDQAVAADWQDIPLVPGQQPGRDGTKPLIEGFAAAFPDASVTFHELNGGPCRAAARAEISGIHRGEFLGIAATGKRFVVPVHEFHHFSGGRLTHTWHLEDWFGWLNQVGAWPTDKESAS